MDLILWRHAVVLPVSAPDLLRELSENGHLQAAQTAAILLTHLPANYRLLVSPAKRAIQTASALGREFEIIDELAPGASIADVVKAANWQTEEMRDEVVVVVGHQPTLGLTVSELLFGYNREIPFKNSYAYWLTQKLEDGKIKTSSRGMVKPELDVEW